MKLSILIPVYNEEKTVKKVIDLVKKVNLGKVKKEIIVVDDKSTDKTLKVLEQIKDIKLIKHARNKGKGAAIKTAIQNASGDIIIIQDADLEYDPNDYNKLIKPIIDKKALVVYGSRRLNKKNKQYSGLSFFLGGVLLTWAFNILFLQRITDEPTCYKTFKADIIKKIDFKGQRFEWEPEVTAKIAKKGIKIHEVPINYYPRSAKEGKKIKWKDGIQALWILIKERFTK